MDNKSDKQLVWEALKRIEELTLDVNSHQFVILPEDIWITYSNDVKLRLRGLLLTNSLVHLVGNNQWAFQLTAAGMTLKETDLEYNGLLKPKKTYKQFWIGVLATGIGAVLSTVLSAGLEVWKSNNLHQSPQSIVVRPKVQVLHDTIWLGGQKSTPKNP